MIGPHHQPTHSRRNRRRASSSALRAGRLVLLSALSLFIGMVALSVDVGFIMQRLSQSQNASDGAALAGAAGYAESGGVNAVAESEAVLFASKNPVDGAPATVIPASDIDIIPAEQKVRVRVHNIASRGNAVPTFFARIFGVNTVDVSSSAAAKVLTSGGANCLLPYAPPDRFDDNDGDGQWSAGDTYCSPTDEANGTCTRTATMGYQAGDLLELLPPTSGSNFPGNTTSAPADQCHTHPSWRCWWAPFGGGGVPGVVDALSCEAGGQSQADQVFTIGHSITANSQVGVQRGPTLSALHNIIVSDPTAWYNPQNPGVIEDRGLGNRIVAMAAVDPTKALGTGANGTAPIADIYCIMLHSVNNQPPPPDGSYVHVQAGGWGSKSAWAYILPAGSCAGVGDGTSTGLFTLQLVE